MCDEPDSKDGYGIRTCCGQYDDAVGGKWVSYSVNPIALLLPIRPLKDRKRMCFSVEDPFVERDDLLIGEKKVEVFKATEIEGISSRCCASTYNIIR